jgi:tRNA pseudouridine55 synthase
MVGILNLDKPAGISSQAALTRLKRSCGEPRIGHAGTLDPLATGVLPVFLGRATVLAERLLRAGKTYEAAIRLGAGSDTDDAAGTLVPAPVPADLDRAAVESALRGFVGRIRQRPPAYSAVKVEGERSYKLARRGGEQAAPAPAEREVEVRAIELTAFENGPADADPGFPAAGGLAPVATLAPALAAGPLLRVVVDCGSGFYVRALARDLGRALGTRGHLESLRRTRVGELRVEDAIPLAEAQALGPELAARLLPPALALEGLLRVEVGPAGTVPLRHGNDIPAIGAPDGEAWAADAVGRVLALGRIRRGRFLPHRLVELS